MQETTSNGSRNANRATLEECSFEDLAAAVTMRLEQARERTAQQLAEVEAAQRKLDEKKQHLEEMEQRIFAVADNGDDLIELNVGGQHMSTTRKVLCSAEGSLLHGMFSGNFDSGHKRDKDGRIFLDVDPDLFKKLLSHLRLRRISSPECPAPLPHVPEDQRAEYEMLVKYYGLDTFMYGDVGQSSNIFERIAELACVNQSKLQTAELVRITLSSTGGVPAPNHEEVLGATGFHERSLENSYGAHPNTITIKFLRHRVRVEAMELRAKVADIVAHMANQWSFRHGSESIDMSFSFSRVEPETGRLATTGLSGSFTDEVVWFFLRDFCLEHIVLYGRVMAK
uniref:BTB domain-containing protein n=1 Tax=Alexandrium monilatum TaxID=311494 RepID=A0A7S4PT73_9DINO